jgi:hypothetical protein
MISLPSRLPLLCVGEEHVPNYEAAWIEDCLRRAAADAGHEAWWPAADVARGIVHFLRERFQQNIITLQDLFQRIDRTLKTIGYPEIAEVMQVESPPLTIDLLEIAQRSESSGLELLFFHQLREEITRRMKVRPRTLICVRSEAAMALICGKTPWSEEANQLLDEVRDFIPRVAAQAEVPALLVQLR